MSALIDSVAGMRGAAVWPGVLALCLVQFVDVLGVTVVVTALPRMLADLHAPDSAGTLIATGYAMFFGGLLMLGADWRSLRAPSHDLGRPGRVRDSRCPRRERRLGCRAAAARCLQGGAAAVSVPSALRLLTTMTSEGPQRRRAVAMWSAAGAAAGASGFVVGGVVTELAGWRVVFWAYLPLAIALAISIAVAVHELPSRDPVPLAIPSVATFTAAVMLFVVATTVLPQAHRVVVGVLLLVGAAGAAALFVHVDRRAVAPLLPARLLAERPLRAGATGSFLNTATTSSAITLVTLYLQDARGHSPLTAGLMLLPFSLAVIAGSALAAPALSRWASRRVMAAGLTSIAAFDLALVVTVDSDWALPVCVMVGGFGIGLSSVAATGLGTSVSVANRGIASGVVNTAAQLGTAVGIAVLLLVTSLTDETPAPGTAPPFLGWALAAMVCVIGSAAFARRSTVRENATSA